jgi:hypothetical protein
MNPDRIPLGQALHAAARELDAQWPSPALPAEPPARLRQALAARRAPPGPRARQAPAPLALLRGGRWLWGGALACSTVLAVSVLLMLRLPPPLPTLPDALAGGFVPLVPPERWPREAAAAWLVDTEIPGERLAALGLPLDPARAGHSVRAEMLVHPSGELLAVRFVP